VDTTKTITHVSLCAGYGGIDLGLKRAIPNLRTIAFSEIEAFATANLVSKMEAGLLDAAPIWTDLKTFPWGKFRGVVDILSGGYPCQPFSAAGKRLGTEDPRHLWPYIADGIAAMRPSVCFFENVEGHISLGLPDVIEDLGRLGYRTTWGIFSASEVGAPHQRKRVFIMAHRDGYRSKAGFPRQKQGHEGIAGVSDNHSGQGEQLGNPRGTQLNRLPDQQWSESIETRQSGNVWPSRPGQLQFSWEPPRIVDSNSKTRAVRHMDDATNPNDKGWESKMESRGGNTWGESEMDSISQQYQGTDGNNRGSAICKTEPSLGGDPNGASCGVGHAELYVSCDNRTDELRLLGNGVVPATAELAFRTLWDELIK
jgi:DNA (cytosine-5)-methyltransferase 1